MPVDGLSDFDMDLLDGFQREFPLQSQPYAALAKRLGCDETTVLRSLRAFVDRGLISRVGPVFAPHRAGASTLAAMAVPADRVDEVAALVNRFDEVNHNYEREHRLNLWFVVAAPSAARVRAVLDEIAACTGLEVLDLPLQEAFHIDLGFPLKWT